ncbi:unnamed protein product, partial [marine sediment metagenome]
MTRHHLAVFWPVYLEMILAGRKQMECRLSRHPGPPYDQVAPGDWLWLKQSSGPILGRARVAHAACQRIGDPQALYAIHGEYNHMIRAQPGFWSQRTDCRYCTLLWLAEPVRTAPIYIRKSDRRAWVVLEGQPAWARTV